MDYKEKICVVNVYAWKALFDKADGTLDPTEFGDSVKRTERDNLLLLATLDSKSKRDLCMWHS